MTDAIPVTHHRMGAILVADGAPPKFLRLFFTLIGVLPYEARDGQRYRVAFEQPSTHTVH